MRRLHLFEIHDQDWCPHMIRDAETDYLQFVIAKTKPYAAMVPVLVTALQRTGTRQVPAEDDDPKRWIKQFQVCAATSEMTPKALVI